MATFGELQTKVSKRLLDPDNVSIDSSDVADSINDAIRYWKFRRFWFNEVDDSTTLTAQDSTIPLDTLFLVPVKKTGAFNIEYSSQRYPLAKISGLKYDSLVLANGYGLPRAYAWTGQKFELYPLPDRDYTLNRHYLKDYADLVDDGDTNDFTDNAERLIVLWACADLSAEFKQDDIMETYYRASADDQAKNLLLLTGKNNSTGTTTNHSIL